MLQKLSLKKRSKSLELNKISRKAKFYQRKLSVVFSLFLKLSVVAAMLFSFYVLGIKSEKLNISNIEVKGANSFVNELDLKEVTKNNSYGQNIVFFPSPKLVSTLTSTFLGAKEIIVEKKLPNTLVINVKERTPLALFDNQEPNFYLVDEDGYVLGQVEQAYIDLPIINFKGDLLIGTFIDKNIIPTYLKVISSAEEAEVNITSMSFSDKFSELYLKTDTLVLLDNAKDIRKMIYTVKSLLDEAQKQDQNISKIDLRYDKVIVLFKTRN